MTDQERYSAVMRHDYPKDFIPDSEWDFIESVASWGKNSASSSMSNNVAPKGVKGKGRNMAKEQKQPSRSIEERIEWYNGRLNSPYSTEKERNHAVKRLAALTARRDMEKAVCNKSLPATQEQNNAFNAGLGFGAAKVGARVPVKDENKPSFRAGVERGRALK